MTTAAQPVSGPAGRVDHVAELAPFVDAGVLGPFEQQLVEAVVRLEPRATPHALLALAMAARAPRFGHVCVELGRVRDQVVDGDDTALADRDLPWPDLDGWSRQLEGSSIVASPDRASEAPLRPLVWDGRRVYLQRYWYYELLVADDLARRAIADDRVPEGTLALRFDEPDPEVERTLDELFGPDAGADGPDLQREAARRALTRGVSIISGGPGTGKTHVVVRILVAAHLLARAQGRDLLVALTAPTGKAAARMGEALQARLVAPNGGQALDVDLARLLAGTEPTTVHRLLGRGDRTHFRHDRTHPLPHDLVIVDETSMVSLPLMAKLLDAIRPDARLVLVGDPFQLTSIEAGTVMGDVVGPSGATGGWRDGAPLAGRVTELRRRRRFADDSAIAAVADAVRAGDPDLVIGLLVAGGDRASWVSGDGADMDEVGRAVVAAAIEVAEAAVVGDAAAALDAAARIKVLTAVRRTPSGMYEWSDRIEAAVTEAVPQARRVGRWRLGTPIIVTGNDPVNRVFNGDVGVVVSSEGRLRVALATGAGVRLVAPARLAQWEPWWAMTIHKSQGSEFSHPHPGAALHGGDPGPGAVDRDRERGDHPPGRRPAGGPGIGAA
jgi:exodeoxyribonuclease V alpha subunit